MIDSVENKIVDIYQPGATYSFTAMTSPEPVKRFKIVTSKPDDSTYDSNQTGTITTNLEQPTSNKKI